MKSLSNKKTEKKYITNAKGKVEFVLVPVGEYEKVIELLEDYGLGLAIKEAEGSKRYTKKEALRFLND
jgi:hypothetical protein